MNALMPDERVNTLNRRAIESGDPAIGFQAYMADRQAREHAPRDYSGFSEEVIDIGNGVRLRLCATSATHIHVENKGRENDQDWSTPLVVNRVPVRFSAHYVKRDDGDWWPAIPPDYRGNGSRGTQSWDEILQAPTYWGSFYFSRADKFTTGSDGEIGKPTQRKVVEIVSPHVKRWAESKASTLMLEAEASDANRKIRSAESDLAEALEKVSRLQEEIGRLYIAELRTGKRGSVQHD